jgi:hypothetical protein
MTKTAILISRPYPTKTGEINAAAKLDGQFVMVILRPDQAKWNSRRHVQVEQHGNEWRAK